MKLRVHIPGVRILVVSLERPDYYVRAFAGKGLADYFSELRRWYNYCG
jgi:hypothetical protein